MAASPLERAYRAQLAAIRDRVVTTVGSAFDEGIDPAAIVASFDAFAERVAATIEAGQAAAQTLTLAFLEQLAAEQGIEWEPLPETEVGANREGTPLAPALAGAAPFILGAIAAGAGLADALASGRSYATRFADNETRDAADREQENQERASEIVAWRGRVSAGACERCQVNEGEHDLSEDTYRHPGCDCERIPVFAAA